MQVTLTEKSIAWLEAKRIFFSDSSRSRLKAGMQISFPDNLEVEPYVGIFAGNVICKIGAFSYSNSPLSLHCSIGRYCSVGGGVKTNFWRHPIQSLSTSVVSYNKKISIVSSALSDFQSDYSNFVENPQKKEAVIENDVWIGTGAYIMPGLTLSTGAVIAAGSVVTKSVGPYEIVGGNPATVIRKRFSDATIDRLLESRWWNYLFTDFKNLNFHDPDKFLEEFDSSRFNEFVPQKIKIADIAT